MDVNFQVYFVKPISQINIFSRSCEIGVAQNPLDDNSTHVRVMAWCQTLPERMLTQLYADILHHEATMSLLTHTRQVWSACIGAMKNPAGYWQNRFCWTGMPWMRGKVYECIFQLDDKITGIKMAAPSHTNIHQSTTWSLRWPQQQCYTTVFITLTTTSRNTKDDITKLGIIRDSFKASQLILLVLFVVRGWTTCILCDGPSLGLCF